MQPWYPFYWKDYSGKTLHLTMGQHGAYMLLMRYLYTTGKRIPHQQRFSIARASLEHECADVEAVLAEFFKRKGDEWYHEKVDEVVEEAEGRHQAYVRAGQKGGKIRHSKAQAEAKPGYTNYNHNKKEKGGAPPRDPSAASAQPPRTIDPSWNGYQAKLSSILQHGDTEFMAYFANSRLETGPPATLSVPSGAIRDAIIRKHGSKLSRLFGPIDIQVSKDVNA